MGSKLRLWSLITSIFSFFAAVGHVLYLTGVKVKNDKLSVIMVILLPILDTLSFSAYFVSLLKNIYIIYSLLLNKVFVYYLKIFILFEFYLLYK